MRTLTYLLFISLFSSVMGFAQNRIHQWDIEKITAITVEFTDPAGETTDQIFDTQQDMDAIMSFLKNVTFRAFDSNEAEHEAVNDQWKCKMLFKGQRDQVYLFKKKAFIGKTSFVIDENVLEEFRMLVQKLGTDK